MAVTEQQRHRLLTWFEEQMGPDLGATMRELLPPNDRSELATKAHVALVRRDLRTELAVLRADFGELRTELTGDIADLRVELHRVKDDLTKSFATWLFASQAAIIAAVGLLLALTR